GGRNRGPDWRDGAGEGQCATPASAASPKFSEDFARWLVYPSGQLPPPGTISGRPSMPRPVVARPLAAVATTPAFAPQEKGHPSRPVRRREPQDGSRQPLDT